MLQQFDEVSWYVESYLITTNIAINSLSFFKMYCRFCKGTVNSKNFLSFSDTKFFFVLLFRGRLLIRTRVLRLWVATPTRIAKQVCFLCFWNWLFY